MARFGAGRPASHPEVFEIAPLTKADLENFVPAIVSQEKGGIKQLKDSHHRIAHLCAIGLRNNEIAEITGYSIVRISTLRASPAFVELVAKYRVEVNLNRQTEADAHYTQIVRLRNLAVGELIDRFEDDEARDKFANSHLIALAADGSDRTGYPKRRENINMNQDFASRLDRAIERSNGAKVIEGEVVETPVQNAPIADNGGGQGPSVHPSSELMVPVTFRRRA